MIYGTDDLTIRRQLQDNPLSQFAIRPIDKEITPESVRVDIAACRLIEAMVFSPWAEYTLQMALGYDGEPKECVEYTVGSSYSIIQPTKIPGRRQLQNQEYVLNLILTVENNPNKLRPLNLKMLFINRHNLDYFMQQRYPLFENARFPHNFPAPFYVGQTLNPQEQIFLAEAFEQIGQAQMCPPHFDGYRPDLMGQY